MIIENSSKSHYKYRKIKQYFIIFESKMIIRLKIYLKS